MVFRKLFVSRYESVEWDRLPYYISCALTDDDDRAENTSCRTWLSPDFTAAANLTTRQRAAKHHERMALKSSV
jgi:hypothetical protein